MNRLIILYQIISMVMILSCQYTDDMDYSDYDIYEDSSIENFTKSIDIAEQQRVYEYNKISEKLYRYTKHRIPGYDYDELDLIDNNNIQQCDERSIWTHCLCQFTCFNLNQVDCYTPCESGCECKENYVFDELTGQCVYPEYCPVDYDD